MITKIKEIALIALMVSGVLLSGVVGTHYLKLNRAITAQDNFQAQSAQIQTALQAMVKDLKALNNADVNAVLAKHVRQ